MRREPAHIALFHTTVFPSAFANFGSIFFSSCTIFFCSAQSISAQVRISEIYPAPATGESEWVEVFNTGTESAQLLGWTLEDTLTSPSTIFVFTDQILAAGERFVAYLTTAKLNNTSDGVVLKNNSGDTVHSISYVGSSPGLSWSVAAGGELYESSPTPGSVNAPQPPPATPLPTSTPTATPHISPPPTPQPTAASSQPPTPSPPLSKSYSPAELIQFLHLTEINPCPTTGESEWLELYSTAPESISFSNWRVLDESGNTRSISGSISPNSYQTFSWSGSLLNNSGDSLTLTATTGEVLGTVEYVSCTSGTTKALINDSWVDTVPTPGAPPETTVLTSATSTPSALSARSTSPTPLASPTSSVLSSVSEMHSSDSENILRAPQKLLSAALAALYEHHPPPTLQYLLEKAPRVPLLIPTNPATPNLQQLPHMSVILGGFCLLCAAGLKLYEWHTTSTHYLDSSTTASVSLGWHDLLLKLAERVAKL